MALFIANNDSDMAIINIMVIIQKKRRPVIAVTGSGLAHFGATRNPLLSLTADARGGLRVKPAMTELLLLRLLPIAKYGRIIIKHTLVNLKHLCYNTILYKSD